MDILDYDVKSALTRMNNLYGRGWIESYTLSSISPSNRADYEGVAVRKLQFGSDTAKFYIKDGVLFFKERRMKLKERGK